MLYDVRAKTVSSYKTDLLVVFGVCHVVYVMDIYIVWHSGVRDVLVAPGIMVWEFRVPRSNIMFREMLYFGTYM